MISENIIEKYHLKIDIFNYTYSLFNKISVCDLNHLSVTKNLPASHSPEYVCLFFVFLLTLVQTFFGLKETHFLSQSHTQTHAHNRTHTHALSDTFRKL